MPSEKYSFSFSPLRFANASTATDSFSASRANGREVPGLAEAATAAGGAGVVIGKDVGVTGADKAAADTGGAEGGALRHGRHIANAAQAIPPRIAGNIQPGTGFRMA